VKQGSLLKIVAKLQSHYGNPLPPKTTDALGMIIHENIAYLASDEKRDAAFDVLKKKTGLKPTKILAVSMEQLVEIASLGGVHPELRAARLKEIARIVLQDFGGDLAIALQQPLAKAKKSLQMFPAIGAPGAEKILLFTRTYPVLGLESNGLRVLLRLGFGEEARSYAASYASVQRDLEGQLGADYDFLIRAHQLLRQHGQKICRRTNPACEICPLKSNCDYYAEALAPRRHSSSSEFE
jgi:endonuclease III